MATESYGRNFRKKARSTRPSELKRLAKSQLKNARDLDKAFEIINDSCAEYLSWLAYDKALDILEREWYGRMTPKDYDRTYDLLSALNVSKDYRGHYSVGIDARSLIQTSRTDSSMSLGQHMGFHDEPVASEIWSYINEGNGDSPIDIQGIDIIGKVEKYLNEVAEKEVRRFLTEAGFELI